MRTLNQPASVLLLPTYSLLPPDLTERLQGAPVATFNPATGAAGRGLPLLDGDCLDLTDLATRAVILQALVNRGYGRTWMLGGCWSGLTNQQAARCCVATLTALSEGRPPPRTVLRAAARCHQGGGSSPAETWIRDTLEGERLGWAVSAQPSTPDKTKAWSWWVGNRGGNAEADPTQAAVDAAHAQGALLVGVDL